MNYGLLKDIHVTCVVLSGAGFLLRVGLMLRSSPLLAHRLVRTLPHLIDSVLLGSALTMAWMSGQYPFVQPWLTAKFFGLLAYILLGSIALKRGRTPAARRWAAAGAVAAFAYIVLAAMTRQAFPGT